MADNVENELSKNHWATEDFCQRKTVAEWRKILLEERDTITWRGHVRKLVGRNIGFGVVEVTKAPLDA